MPPILSEEPPNPNESEEEEDEVAAVDDNSAEDMEEDSTASDFELSHEFTALDKRLDELNGVLDAIEAKNDDIHGKLKEFLQASRQERLEMNVINTPMNDSSSETDHKKEEKS